MQSLMGSKFGNSRRATILKYNEDGTVLIALDEIGLQQLPTQAKVPMPLAWAGPDGEFIGGYPAKGSSVIVKQSQGGQWFIESYIPSRNVFKEYGFSSILRPGRAVMQVKNGNRIFADPKIGIQLGNSEQYLHLDPNKEIFSHNFGTFMSFTESARTINGIVKRDIKENLNRGLGNSILYSQSYDDMLTNISSEPSTTVALKTGGEYVRNPPLVEYREIIYEFADSFDVGTDLEEASRIDDPLMEINKLDNVRQESRANILNLGLYFPNHLIETVKGTVVDIFGNILDLNRNILPIGRIDQLSLKRNSNKSDAYARIRAQKRKSIAYHFEINTRKAGIIDSNGVESVSTIPDINDTKDYARSRSRFFFDIDHEGQFKLNVPQSSETGNVPLLTRNENYSSLLASQNPSVNNNTVTKNVDRQDIFLDSFSTTAKIKLRGTDSLLDGYEAPIDRLTGKPIMLGTAYHDITQACASYLPGAPTMNLYEENLLTSISPYEKLVEDTIIVSGAQANAGGRSGLLNIEGSLIFNVGANTSDRQSLWSDFAGGIVTQIGRDKRGISHAMQLDGDMIIQIGGPGIDNEFDSRFTDQNDSPRIGALDIRIIDGNRPMTIIRIDRLGIKMATEGVLHLTGQQGIVLSTQGDLELNGERAGFFTNTSGLKRIVERNGIPL